MLTSLKSALRLKLSVVLMAATALTGCMEAGTQFAMPVAAARRVDPCVSAKAPFVKLRRDRNQRMAAMAIVGATAAAAIAKSRRASSKQTMIAALIGGLGGAALGYYYDKQKRTSSTSALRSSIRGDAARTVRSSDQLIRSLQQLNTCRIREVRSVVAKQRSGKITQAQAKATLRAIQASARADNRLINGVVGDISGDQRLYVNALGRSGDTNAKRATTAASRYKPKVVNPQATAGSRTISTRPIAVVRRRPSNSVTNISYAAKELDAGGDAHVDAVEDAIAVANELLI